MLFFIPLRQVFWGFDDQPLLDVMAWMVVGLVAAVFLFSTLVALIADGELGKGWKVVMLVAALELIAWPSGILMTHYVERINVHGILSEQRG